MEFIQSNAAMTDNITLVLKDTGDTARGAAAAASQAVSEGASLVLGPLRADQVTAAGAVAHSAGIPVIAFSNNSGVASEGVYLLNVLPETETERSLGYARRLGKKAIAGIFPGNSYGTIQQSAFTQAAADLGLGVRATYTFGSEAEARSVVDQIAPMILAGQIDALFLPDRGTAPSFGALLQEAGVPAGKVQIIGSADWGDDKTIENTPALAGAIYPAVDDTGYNALLPLYQERFGGTPHPFVTLAYTAVVLANAPSLATASPRYSAALLTAPAGFRGRDGVFRFLPDGRSDYALAIRAVTIGGSAQADGPRL
jgi:ABC-type branched-subunit amino acid transport system substrate-binding protein